MTISKPLARALAPLLAVVLAIAAFAAVSATTAPAADAAAKPKVKIKQKAPYKKNQLVTVKVSGFPAKTAVAVGFCPAKLKIPGGPGDCGVATKNFSYLGETNKKGKVTVKLNVPKGKLFANNYPSAKCTNKKKKGQCRLFASTLQGQSSTVVKTKPIKY